MTCRWKRTRPGKVNLKMFDGEGGAAAGTAGAASAPAGNEISASQIIGQMSPEQPQAAAEQKPAEQPKNAPSREEQFAKLIAKDGEYGDLYRQNVQRAVSDRLARAQRRAEAVQPVLDLLQQRYATDDPARIAEELGKDNDFWQAGADKAGMDVDDYRNLQQIKAREQRLRAQVEQMTAQREQSAKIAEWEAQAAELRQKYPGFDLDREAMNPTFSRMLAAGASVENAYQMLHHDELVNAAVNYAMGRAQKSVADSVRANGMRPAENGVNGSSAPVSLNLADLSREQRNEMFSRQRRTGAKVNLR